MSKKLHAITFDISQEGLDWLENVSSKREVPINHLLRALFSVATQYPSKVNKWLMEHSYELKQEQAQAQNVDAE